MNQLTSRERLRLTLNHQEPDKIPIDIGGTLSTGFNRLAHSRLKEHLGIKGGKVEVVHIMQQEVRPDIRIRNMFGSDTYGIWPHVINSVRLSADTYKDEWGVEYKYNQLGHHYSIAKHPLKDATTDELEEYAWPDPRHPSRTKGLTAKAKELYAQSKLALIAGGTFSSGPFHHCAWLLGLEDFLVRLLLDKTFSREILERVVSFHLGYWETMLSAVGKYVEVAVIADDLGTNESLMISPELYREMIKPVHKKIIECIKGKANVKVLLHSDGNVYPLIPDLIEIGVDALNPIQYTIKDMDTERLKKEFGDKLVFWGGGCETQYIMTTGSKEDIDREVRLRVGHLAPGGGFVFAQTHNIQPDVPPENVIQMYTSAKLHGNYKV
jgi:uroporphyrinogen decarboxylase